MAEFGEINTNTEVGTPPFATAGGAPAAHGASHKHLGGDEVSTATPGANEIPKALASGKLADGWVSETSVTQHEAAIDHDALDNFEVGEHRVINDAGTSTTELWSASKIDSELSAIIAGIDVKPGVDTSTFGLGNITLSGEQTLNGVLTSGSRVLVTEQSVAADNGIYITAAGAWSRAADADEDAEVTNGNIVHVINSGSTEYKNKYILVTPDPITVGATGQTWERHADIEFGTTSGTATEGNDSRVPTQDENDALAGTDGTPSSSNKYVTDSDPRNSDARPPTGSAGGDLTLTYPNPDIATDAVDNTKLADMAQATIKGRASGAGTGDPVDLTPAQVRTILNVEDGANNYVHPNHTGDVTSVGDGAQTIANNAVTNAKAADMAANTVKARADGSAGDPQDVSVGANTVLGRQAGNIVAAQVATGQIANGAVTNAKSADMAQATIKGRAAGAGTGAPTDLTAAQVRTILNVEDGADATPDATETVKGKAEIATQAETDAGADDTRFVTPLKLANYPGLTTPDATETVKGKAEIATQAETDAGTDDTRFVTPLKLANYVGLGGDVTAAVAIPDNQITRGDGGVKGIQGSLWSILDTGEMQTTQAHTGWAMMIVNNGQVSDNSGKGVTILAGEIQGDVVLHLNDQDDSFGGTGGAIMEVEADDGHITFYKTYAQTIADRGIVYGIDNQGPGITKDFHTQFGGYRVNQTLVVENDQDLAQIKNIRFAEEFNNGNSGAADTIDWNAGQKQLSTITANVTYTFTAPVDGVSNFLIRLVQGGAGGFTVTWPGTVLWPGGVAPTLNTAAGTEHIVSFYWNGTNYYGVANTSFA